jgi:hypothetical protein
MTDDIVDRLRRRERLRDSTRMLRLSTRLLLNEAAAEIERLRERVAELETLEAKP